MISDNLKIAIVHDWILGLSGAERVLKVLHEMFPQAPIYTLLYDKKFTKKFLPKVKIRTTFLNNIFKVIRRHGWLAPLMPIAIESLDLSEFDLVISSSATFSKGLILKPKARHICYCYSPTRQVWDWHTEYRKEKSNTAAWIIALYQHWLRIWDRQASFRVDQFVAISKLVQDRIKKYYNQDSIIIYPPVATLEQSHKKIVDKNYFLIVSRLFANKNVDIAVKAFNKLGWPLIVIGDGPERKKLQKLSSKNIKFLGYQSDAVVSAYYQNCLAFVMPQEEDFGITPIEAFSFGKPVLALKRGGALEYIEEGINGKFFDDPVPDVLVDGARRLKENLANYDSQWIRQKAEKFSVDKFKEQIWQVIYEKK